MNSGGHYVLSCKTSVAKLIDNVYFRYRRQKRDGATTKQGGQRSRVFNNGASTFPLVTPAAVTFLFTDDFNFTTSNTCCSNDFV